MADAQRCFNFDRGFQVREESDQSINPSYWDSVPVKQGSPVRKTAPVFIPETNFGDSQRREKDTPKTTPGMRAGKLALFAIATLISCFTIQMAMLLKQAVEPPTYPANSNMLATGSTARFTWTKSIPVEPPCELDNLTKEQILSLRRSYVAKHPELMASAYTPYPIVWKDIVDNRPWWGFKGYYWNSQGDHNDAGPSLEGAHVANPWLLATPDFENHRRWEGGNANPDAPAFEFTCPPTDFKWSPAKNEMEVTYDLTAFYNRYKSIGGLSKLKTISTARICDYNALDFGFTWKHIAARGGPEGNKDLTPGVVPIYQFVHGGQTMGIPCNNSGTIVKSDWDEFHLKPNTDIVVKLWRTRPASASDKADMQCIWHIR